MKNILYFLTVSCALIMGCNSKNLTREEAFQQLQQDRHYPKLLDYDVYCGDVEQAKKMIDAGLEAQGLLTVKRTQKLGEIGSPLIRFTDKAITYLLPTTESDKSSNIQKVKVADEDLVEVTAIKTGQTGKEAVVEFKTAYKNVTPFSVLVPTDFKLQASRKATFVMYDDGWKLEK